MVDADHLPRKDETAIGSRWFPKFGGKGGNQAVSAAKAGVESRMVGAVGNDDFASFLRANLTKGGVEDRFIATAPDVGSGMSVAIQDADGDYAATIVSGANLHISAAALTDDAVWNGVSVLILQNEVPEAINLAAAAERRPLAPLGDRIALLYRCSCRERGRGRDDGHPTGLLPSQRSRGCQTSGGSVRNCNRDGW
jgi:ribokinase